MGWFDNINKVPLSGPGVMSGRQAAGRAHRGGPGLCQGCWQRPARVSFTIKGKKSRVCFECAPAPDTTPATGTKSGGKAKKTRKATKATKKAA